MRPDRKRNPRRLAYFSAQAVIEGQDTWAAVMEFIGHAEEAGWRVDLYRPKYRAGRIPGVVTRLWRIAAEERRLARHLSSYDAVYVRVHPLAWAVARSAGRRGVPVIQECNGSWEDVFVAWPGWRWAGPLAIASQRAQYSAADAVIAVSQGLADWLADVAGRHDVVVSPNGANDGLFRPGLPVPEGLPERYVVFFGQFAPWQRLEVLLAAVDHAEWPAGIDLVIVGDGALRPMVEAAAARDPRVHYVGVLPYAEVPPVVCNALAALVLTYAPERAGYSPLKLYESMACGVPVICSDTPGQAEFVRAEECGIVVPPEDPAAVARAAAALAVDHRRAQEMGIRGRRAVEERYSWRVRARERLDVVEWAVASNKTQAT